MSARTSAGVFFRAIAMSRTSCSYMSRLSDSVISRWAGVNDRSVKVFTAVLYSPTWMKSGYAPDLVERAAQEHLVRSPRRSGRAGWWAAGTPGWRRWRGSIRARRRTPGTPSRSCPIRGSRESRRAAPAPCPRTAGRNVDGIRTTFLMRGSRLAMRRLSTKPRTVVASRPISWPTTSFGSTSCSSPPGRSTSVDRSATAGPRDITR